MPGGFAKLSDEQLAKVKPAEKRPRTVDYRTYEAKADDLPRGYQVKQLESELAIWLLP